MASPEPIDLEKLEAQIEGEGDVVVERAWLARVHEELRALEAIRERIGQVFGLPKGTTL
ncbi:hypothetical protein [Qipengyuania sp.]|uniref:hypothetical protein n=1 Tax=Qipengyuania sp. TaxID=2004515 RepID=UPI003519C5EC